MYEQLKVMINQQRIALIGSESTSRLTSEAPGQTITI